jgi:hypothetical protein
MPKLSQDQVEAATEQGYEDKAPVVLKALPHAKGEAYVYKLVACEAGLSQNQRPQWKWELTLDGRFHPELINAGYLEKLWHYTATGDGGEWRVAKMLHNFGYSPDTDTDELINDEAPVVVYVTSEIFNDKPSMKARRFAQWQEDEFPMAKSPMQIEAEEQIKEAKAAAAALERIAAAAAAPVPAPVADEDNGEF